jgi:3-phosphoinositide dependent protein kinase-1
MLSFHPSSPPPDSHFSPTLADLSRNASVISTSSSDSVPSLSLQRPRPIRTFTSPRSKSPHSPPHRAVPAYLTKELGLAPKLNTSQSEQNVGAASHARPKSRNRSANAHVGSKDFEFGETLGEGSYSTVSGALCVFLIMYVLTITPSSKGSARQTYR